MNQYPCLKTFFMRNDFAMLGKWPLSNSIFILKGNTFIPLFLNLLFPLHSENRLCFSLGSGEIFLQIGFFSHLLQLYFYKVLVLAIAA